jgi:hypothetical protein
VDFVWLLRRIHSLCREVRVSTAMRAPAGLAMRARVQRVLDAAALEPPGMPTSAVLVVRSLADPLPGRLAPRPGDLRAPAEWESALRGALADQWRTAARPARGPVPAGAGAVYFADTAEMIAAFARDAAAGDVVRWWWRALLKGLPGGPVAALTALWAREARHVPAAIEHLAATGDAARVLSAFAPPQVARILAAVAVAWEATALLAAPPSADPLPAAPPLTTLTTNAADREDAHHPPASGAPSVSASHAPAAPPWSGFLPPAAVPRDLAPEQAALLGVCLLLHRAPHVARGGGFVARFVRWRAETAASPSAARPSPAPPQPRPARAESRPPAPADRASAERMESPASPESLAPDETSADRETRADAHPSPVVDPPAAPPPAESTARGATDRSAGPPIVDGSESAAREADAWEVRVWEAPAEEARAASAACGVFYLVNVLRSLRFHRLLDEHFEVRPTIGGWGWIELVARALLGPRAGGLADDPVWRVLAELDGREPDALPGGGFRPAWTETLPDAWIDLFGGDPPAPAPSPPLGMPRVSADLRRFLDLVVPVIRARIAAALAAAGADPDEPLETSIIRRMGTVEATRTHVDVRMALDQVTLPARMAGLDASPGWMPELARVVTFHFA